jgi:GTP-binding nuclear protein Ran
MTKIVFLGNGGVGKTSFVRVMRTNTFDKRYIATVGAEVHPDNLNGTSVDIWDTAGRQGNHASYITGANICVLFFSLTDQNSYNALADHYAFAQQHAPNAQFIVVGNKSDLPHTVHNTEWITANNLPYYVISAKSEDDVDQVVAAITQMV